VSDRFWLTKIRALVTNLNLEQIKQNSIDNGEIYFNHLSFILNGSDSEIINYIDTAHQITLAI
jgi:hypothetical protein